MKVVSYGDKFAVVGVFRCGLRCWGGVRRIGGRWRDGALRVGFRWWGGVRRGRCGDEAEIRVS